MKDEQEKLKFPRGGGEDFIRVSRRKTLPCLSTRARSGEKWSLSERSQILKRAGREKGENMREGRDGGIFGEGLYG